MVIPGTRESNCVWIRQGDIIATRPMVHLVYLQWIQQGNLYLHMNIPLIDAQEHPIGIYVRH
jgi:hypothetical protein